MGHSNTVHSERIHGVLQKPRQAIAMMKSSKATQLTASTGGCCTYGGACVCGLAYLFYSRGFDRLVGLGVAACMYPGTAPLAGGQALRLIVKPHALAHRAVLTCQESLLTVITPVFLLFCCRCFSGLHSFATCSTVGDRWIHLHTRGQHLTNRLVEVAQCAAGDVILC